MKERLTYEERAGQVLHGLDGFGFTTARRVSAQQCISRVWARRLLERMVSDGLLVRDWVPNATPFGLVIYSWHEAPAWETSPPAAWLF